MFTYIRNKKLVSSLCIAWEYFEVLMCLEIILETWFLACYKFKLFKLLIFYFKVIIFRLVRVYKSTLGINCWILKANYYILI